MAAPPVNRELHFNALVVEEAMWHLFIIWHDIALDDIKLIIILNLRVT